MSVVGDRQAIIDAVKGRRSIRRFLPTPVADETVLEIIEIAARAPSGQNMQHWLIHFDTGETRDALCRQVTEAADSGERSDDYPYFPTTYRGIYFFRRCTVGILLL